MTAKKIDTSELGPIRITPPEYEEGQLRKDANTALTQLTMHSQTRVEAIRRYLLHLERELTRERGRHEG